MDASLTTDLASVEQGRIRVRRGDPAALLSQPSRVGEESQSRLQAPSMHEERGLPREKRAKRDDWDDDGGGGGGEDDEL